MPDDRERALRRAAELGIEFLAGLGERHVGALTDDAGIVAKLGGPLPDEGEDPVAVVEQMARDFDPGRKCHNALLIDFPAGKPVELTLFGRVDR